MYELCVERIDTTYLIYGLNELNGLSTFNPNQINLIKHAIYIDPFMIKIHLVLNSGTLTSYSIIPD